MAQKPTVSAVILTKNEENHIQRCIKSLTWVDELIIVDDYSTDDSSGKAQNSKLKTQNKNLKLKIFKNHLKGDFAAQRNYGLEKATSVWVLYVDADEVISDSLASEIKLQITNDELQIGGYYLKRKDYFLGKWLENGETDSVKLVRLAKKNAGRWRGKVHEVWKVNGKLGELKNPFHHYPHPTIADFLNEINIYTDLLALQWKKEKKEIAIWEIVLFPLGKFLMNYFTRFGFLDGTPGFIVAAMMSYHSFLARAKLWQMQNAPRR